MDNNNIFNLLATSIFFFFFLTSLSIEIHWDCLKCTDFKKNIYLFIDLFIFLLTHPFSQFQALECLTQKVIFSVTLACLDGWRTTLLISGWVNPWECLRTVYSPPKRHFSFHNTIWTLSQFEISCYE